MSWLNEIKRNFHYLCECGCKKSIILKTSESITNVEKCINCEAVMSQNGFTNISADEGGAQNKRNIVSSFDKNGRKAVKIGKTYMSKSKLDYLNTGEITDGFTPGFEAHLAKQTQNEVAQKLQDFTKNRDVNKVINQNFLENVNK